MSLIEEALRRVQDPVVAAEPWLTKGSTKISPKAPTKRLVRPLPYAFALVAMTVVVLSLGFVLGAVLWGKRMLVQQPFSKQPVAVPAPSTTAAVAGEEKLVVTGVVEGRGEPYAVINGAIVAVGEHIHEYTLLEIADGTVRLRGGDGKDVTLRVRR